MARLAHSLIVAAILFLAGCGRNFENPSDPDAGRFSETSEAFLRRLDSFDLVEGDTARFYGGVTSPEVESDSLVLEYAWDLDDDGDADTTLPGTDTVAVRVGSAGTHKLGLTLTDKAGFRSRASLDYRVHPRLSRVFQMKGYASDCPAYAQEPVLMRLALALSHFTTERTREEGIGTTDFALKLARAVTGTAFPIGLLDGFDYSFSRGVYSFRNGALNFEVAFHYGPGTAGHSEGDTIRSNLFDLDSYVRGVSVSGFPPSLRYTRGPLADLIEGEISVDADDIDNPEFDFGLDFNRLRFSFSRGTRTLLVLSNLEITLANALFFTLFEGKARIDPVYPPELLRLFGKDSLELDFSGTKVSSPELPLLWPYEENGVKDTAVYRLSMVQETVRQIYRFGDEGGVRKVFGSYSAINRFGAGEADPEAIYFRGGYSSLAPDSAHFYCRESMEEKEWFGVAAFETETEGRGDFEAERFGYGFTFPYSTVEPWSGTEDKVPMALRLPGIALASFPDRTAFGTGSAASRWAALPGPIEHTRALGMRQAAEGQD